ncbi:pinin isoform X1 [Anastrepha ludens]|uniref:pinin isoform X1 n=1 Tax=Anastrepha ludens TaxID=28586 RepID=UPI0023AF14DD|nr:pinin isoform X1 [Anastrepha ludens]
MDADFTKSFNELQKELDETRSGLDVLNDNIRRIVGRPRDLGIYRNVDQGVLDEGGMKYGNGLKQKRVHDERSVFNRLTIPNEETKSRLSSRVIRELPTRQEVLEAQGSDMESRARNRRMFGSLLGTLHKFCQEESRLKQKEDKKAQIEKKLEEQQLLEQETIKKERDSLLMDRKNKQTKIKTLELKLNRVKDFATFEKSVSNLRHCIRTKTKPFIYYKPYKLSKKTEKLVSITRDLLATEMKERKLVINNELKGMELEDENGAPSTKEDLKSVCVCKNTHDHKSTRPVECAIRPCAVQGETEFKENKSRTLNEPALSSSIIVVKKKLVG